MARRATLIYRFPDGPEQTLVLNPEAETTIGRHPSCTVTISTPSVSRRHARIYAQAGGFYVEDLKSSNGTYINGQRIERGSLVNGDELRCGDFIMRFTEQASASVAPAISAAPAEEPRMSAVPRMVGQLPRGMRAKSLKPATSRAPEASPDVEVPLGRPMPRAIPAGRASHASIPPMPAGRIPAASVPPAAQGPISQGAIPSATPMAPAATPMAPVATPMAPAATPMAPVATPMAPAATPMAPVATPMAPGSYESPAEIAQARAELEQLRTARAELERDLADKARRIQDLEGEDLRKGEQIKTLTDRTLRLREEVVAQQRQMEEYRIEKADLDYALAQARQDAEALQQTQDGSTRNEAALADQVNDLKREVRTRDKELREREQRLEVLEYDLKAASEENENLRLALGDDDQRRREANTTLEHLRQVLVEKETFIEQLQDEVNSLQERLARAEAIAREESGARAGRLEEQLHQSQAQQEQLRGQLHQSQAQLGEAYAHLEQLKAQVEASTTLLEETRANSGSTSRDALAEIDRLKRQNRDLRVSLEEAQSMITLLQSTAQALPVAGAPDAALVAQLEAQHAQLLGQLGQAQQALTLAESRARDAEGRLHEAQVRAQRAEARAAAAPAAVAAPVAAAAPAGDAMRTETVKLYRSLNDLSSELRSNIRLALGCVDDVRSIADLFEGLPPGSLPESLQSQLETVDLDFTLETVGEMLGNAKVSAEQFKRLMLSFRDFLVSQGLTE